MDLPTSLLQPFLDQAVAIRSVITPEAADAGHRTESLPLSLSGLAASQRASATHAPGSDVLAIAAASLQTLMTPREAAFPFAAVIVLWPPASGARNHDEAADLRHALFDRGLVCIAASAFAGGTARCFLASDLVRAPDRITADTHGRITMTMLGRNGRFANQLFQYAYARLYALRHAVVAEFPAWQGQTLYRLDDPPITRPDLPRLSFAGFSDEDRALWKRNRPPVDVDFDGFFQEIPACWQHHRSLLRSLFQLPAAQRRAIDAWREQVTDHGQRTLVAIHVRRGDYRRMQFEFPHFCLIPDQWYLDWLRALWPTLHNPVLYVATDEPVAMRPLFDEFDSVTEAFGAPASSLPEHVREFEILRRADHLAICNSSYSRMAGILAPAAQKACLASVQAQGFVPYEPWIDAAFWTRFGDPSQRSPALTVTDVPKTPATARNETDAQVEAAAALLFDVSDLVQYLGNHATLTGIQRVQCEILRHLADTTHRDALRLVVLSEGHDFRVVATTALLGLIEQCSSGATPRATVVAALRVLLASAEPCTVRPRDRFVVLGAFWPVRGMGRLMQRLKNAGVVIGALIHDVLPLDHPEYFDAGATQLAIRGMFEMLSFADFLITTSQYNRASLQRLMAARAFNPVPVQVVALAREPVHRAAGAAVVAPELQRILDSDYVLCVGTIEVRKNPGYLFNLWQLLVRSGRSDVPCLVFAGRKGWLVRDLMDQLAACDYLGGRIVLVHDATDQDLDLLYRHCRLTMFPSFAEGWGLPVGESLAHGKVCLCAATGGIPDVAGAAGDYIDPYDVRDGLRQLTRYLDDPDWLHVREREIVEQFAPRSWRSVADEFIEAVQILAHAAQPPVGPTAIRLPPERYLSISSEVRTMPVGTVDGLDGMLSADVACASGWQPAGPHGARASDRSALLQFRVDAPTGAAIVVVMRLASVGRTFHLRARAGSGGGIDTRVTANGERVAVLSCQVEQGQLVTIELEADARGALEGLLSRARHWGLRGILYFEPRRLTAEAMQQMLRGEAPGAASSSGLHPAARGHVAGAWRASRAPIMITTNVTMDDSQRCASLADFRRASNAWWAVEAATTIAAPLFATDVDGHLFAKLRSDGQQASLAKRESIKLIRRNDVYVSMARFCEGSIFDRAGAWRALGYLQSVPRDHPAPWLSPRPNGIRIDADALAAVPLLDASVLVFYNGNLHNYFHWVAEGLLCLDVMTQALGPEADVRVALPRSMDIAAVFDHRRTLDEVGLGGRRVVEPTESLIRVREAIWVDSDLIQDMPAQYVQDFNRRIAARHASARAPTRRRLLVARRGPTRMVGNLAQVEALLAPRGFETVYLEGLSMTEQLLLFQSAEFIIGPHGAGLTNVIFCEPGTRVIEFMPVAEFRPFFWMISEKLGLVHGVQFCSTTDGLAFQGTLDVDIGTLGKLVDKVDAAAAARATAQARGSP